MDPRFCDILCQHPGLKGWDEACKTTQERWCAGSACLEAFG